MSWGQLVQLLQEAPLDKEVKLMAIDALSLTQDETIKNELIKLLLEWQASDKQATKAFEQQLAGIISEADQVAEVLQQRQISSQTALADEVGREAAIENIKQHIATL